MLEPICPLNMEEVSCFLDLNVENHKENKLSDLSSTITFPLQ
jgi:hypothetical protein